MMSRTATRKILERRQADGDLDEDGDEEHQCQKEDRRRQLTDVFGDGLLDGPVVFRHDGAKGPSAGVDDGAVHGDQQCPVGTFRLVDLQGAAAVLHRRQGERLVPQGSRADEGASGCVLDLPVVAGQGRFKARVGQNRRHMQRVADEACRADQLVEIHRQVALHPPFDVAFEQIAQSDAGESESDEDRDRGCRPQSEADRGAPHSSFSGTRYPKPRRVSITSLPSLRRSRATITSIAFGSRSWPES